MQIIATREEMIKNKLNRAFPPEQAKVLAEVIQDAYNDLVKVSDFTELKAIVKQVVITQKELAEAQKRTELRLEELAEAQKRTELRLEELAEAQKRTELRLEELAEAQKRTELRLEELAEAQTKTEQAIEKLAKSLDNTRITLGGLEKSVGYSLENEAYRVIPKVMKERFNIEVSERFVRTELEGQEINLFARGVKNGNAVIIVGESKLKLQSIRDLKQLSKKVAAVAKVFPDITIVPLIITHFARPVVLEKANKLDIVVIQSFEW